MRYKYILRDEIFPRLREYCKFNRVIGHVNALIIHTGRNIANNIHPITNKDADRDAEHPNDRDRRNNVAE